MERVVKFRGKTQDGKWVYGDLIHSGSDEIAILEFDAPCLEAVTDVVPESVGQFTGLHDKHGKEIYEGDIVQQTWGSPHFVKGILYDCFGRIGDIRYVCDLIGVHTKNGLYRIVGSDISNTVIGNIHDNPNLLSDGRD